MYRFFPTKNPASSFNKFVNFVLDSFLTRSLSVPLSHCSPFAGRHRRRCSCFVWWPPPPRPCSFRSLSHSLGLNGSLVRAPVHASSDEHHCCTVQSPSKLVRRTSTTAVAHFAGSSLSVATTWDGFLLSFCCVPSFWLSHSQSPQRSQATRRCRLQVWGLGFWSLLTHSVHHRSARDASG